MAISISEQPGSYNGMGWYGNQYYDRKVESDHASDILYGNSSDDYLLGNGGNDTLIGGSGQDILQGSSNFTSSNHEFDVLKGGRDLQADLFIIGNQSGNLYQGRGYAVIENFELHYDGIQLNKNTAIKVEQIQFQGQGGGSSAVDTVIRNATNNDVIAIIQDKSYNFNQLYFDGAAFDFV